MSVTWYAETRALRREQARVRSRRGRLRLVQCEQIAHLSGAPASTREEAPMGAEDDVVPHGRGASAWAPEARQLAGGAGVRPCRRMTSAIFARSGGPPGVDASTS